MTAQLVPDVLYAILLELALIAPYAAWCLKKTTVRRCFRWRRSLSCLGERGKVISCLSACS